MSSFPRLQSSLLFFSIWDFWKDIWIGTLAHCLEPTLSFCALKTKEEEQKRWHGIALLPVARMHVVARRLPLSPSSERSSLCDSFFLNVRWRDSPESRVKRCQIKYKMRCSPFALREKIWDAHFLIVLCAHTYFFDVHVLLRVRVLCIRCEESKHEFGIESPPYKKRWKYPRISAFLRRLFRKLKDVFFFKAHV